MLTMEVWTIIITVAIIAILIGFFIGRRSAGNSQQLQEQTALFEQQLMEKQAQLDNYQQQVHAHYDQTAHLFKDMAGSYKAMFDHLSSSYEQLGNYSDQRVLPERAGALLDDTENDNTRADNQDIEKQDDASLTR